LRGLDFFRFDAATGPTLAHSTDTVIVVGAGLAGAEAAWQLADAGLRVTLFEMRPVRATPAHRTAHAAELVCSNSLGSRLPDRAAGVLQAELRALGSRLLAVAEQHAVPAGAALAVDRDRFAADVTAALASHPNVDFRREEVLTVPDATPCVIASGPLTSEALAADLQRLTGEEHLAFFDAIAPVVTGDSLDRETVFAAARWDRGGPDYLNVPLSKDEYERFVDALLAAPAHPLKEFEASDPRARRFFERCLPVEVLAARGRDALRFGPLRPVGLRNPGTGHRPWAVVQLRREDAGGRLWNMVGFQTNVRHGDQERLLRTLPGMHRAEFVRLGSMHRNTFLNSPRLLTAGLEFRTRPGLFFAGQITGMEGYLGNVASGLLAAHGVLRRLAGEDPIAPPPTTLLGALARHVAESPSASFQPMKAEFGLLPACVGLPRGADRAAAYAARSAADLAEFQAARPLPLAAAAR
jgi:methylenetetrahydrofolate--tRNA-(uracil-5-)-methyltransferase